MSASSRRPRSRTARLLEERTKELTALYGLSRLLQTDDRPVADLLAETAGLLVAAWQYPEVTGVRITYDAIRAATPSFRETPWRQRATFTMRSGRTGTIEVAYLEKRPYEDEGPFLREERALLDSVAGLLRAYFDRSEAVAGLRVSESRFSAFMDDNPIVAWMKDADGRYEWGNRSLARLYGLPVGAVVGRTDESLLPVAVVRQLREHDRHVLSTGASLETIEHVPDDSGRMREWHVWKFPFGDASGRRFVGGVAFDITETQQAKLERDTFFEISMDMLAIVGFDGRFRQVNGAWQRTLGYAHADLLTRPYTELIHPDDRERSLSGMRRLAAGEPLANFENRYRHRDGSYRWVSWNAVPVREQQLVYAVARDITEREASREAFVRQAEVLRESEERYRMLVDGAQDALFSLAPDGVMTSLNPAAETITGWPRTELLGHPFQRLVHEDDLPLAVRQFQEALAGRTPPVFELRIGRKGGGHVPVEFTVTPQLEGDQVVAILGIGRNISERKHLQEQLRQMEKLESIGQLASGIAHDFNNILTVQHGYLSLLTATPGLPVAVNDALQEVVLATERASTLTRQLLLFSRRQPFQPTSLDINAVLDRASRLLERLLGEHITLDIEHGADLPAVRADESMIEQLIVNLAVNARDAMPHGGSLRIHTARVEVDHEPPGRPPDVPPGAFVQVTISDTGTGIPPDVMPHIFEPFFTTKDVGKGTGLGLATVYGIAQQLGGWTSVDSKVGHGTTFHLYVPCAGDTVERVEAEPPPVDTARGPETILVVEDEASLRGLVQRVLERGGYRVLTAATGSAAIGLWEDAGGGIDLLLTDMVLPEGMSGSELTRRLLSHRPTLRVIYTSGYSPDIAGEDLTLRDGFNFLQKPYSPTRLLQLVRQTLDG